MRQFLIGLGQKCTSCGGIFRYSAPPSLRITLIPHALDGIEVSPTHMASTGPTGFSCVYLLSTQMYRWVGNAPILVFISLCSH